MPHTARMLHGCSTEQLGVLLYRQTLEALMPQGILNSAQMHSSRLPPEGVWVVSYSRVAGRPSRHGDTKCLP